MAGYTRRCILYSVDFHEIEGYQSSGDWDRAGAALAGAAVCLEKAGADFIVLCTNTMHKVADAIQDELGVPLLHIADVTAGALVQHGIHKVGLLGTKYTLEQDFYKERLWRQGLEVLVPEEEDRANLNRIIFEELCVGKMEATSLRQVIDMIKSLEGMGAEGIILGCTELGLLISSANSTLPVFDTTLIHAEAAARTALADEWIT